MRVVVCEEVTWQRVEVKISIQDKQSRLVQGLGFSIKDPVGKSSRVAVNVLKMRSREVVKHSKVAGKSRVAGKISFKDEEKSSCKE